MFCFEAFIGKTMDKYRTTLLIIKTDTIWLFILFKLGIMLKLNCVQDTNNIVLNTSTDGLLPEYWLLYALAFDEVQYVL